MSVFGMELHTFSFWDLATSKRIFLGLFPFSCMLPNVFPSSKNCIFFSSLPTCMLLWPKNRIFNLLLLRGLRVVLHRPWGEHRGGRITLLLRVESCWVQDLILSHSVVPPSLTFAGLGTRWRAGILFIWVPSVNRFSKIKNVEKVVTT